MSLSPEEKEKLFDRKKIKKALQVWPYSKKLGKHELTQLEIVEARRVASGYRDTVVGKGVALREVLEQAIEKLKPDRENGQIVDDTIVPLRLRHHFILTGSAQAIPDPYRSLSISEQLENSFVCGSDPKPGALCSQRVARRGQNGISDRLSA